jgi:hypothetical protein
MLQARPACTGRYIQFVAITMTHCIFFSQITCACGGDPAELKAGNSGRAQNDAPQHKLREHLTPRLHDHQSRLLRLEQQMLRTASTEDCTNLILYCQLHEICRLKFLHFFAARKGFMRA